jgi:protein-S-isoprenylcysteine O-methyltransferase Ste14
MNVSSLQATHYMWDVWFLSWIVAAVWSRRTAARPPALRQIAHWVPTITGFGLLAFGSAVPIDGGQLAIVTSPLWSLAFAAGWALAGLCASGLLFTWWARLWLGALWSGSVGRKDGHTVVQSGPYRLVRHPIYTGLILAAFAMAIQIGMAANLIGAGLIAFGFWLKANLEERFLSEELGSEAYAAYRRRTPMLVPFWPV